MAKPRVPEWVQFRVGEPSTSPNWTNNDCCPLDEVTHVTHLASSIRVLERKRIAKGLVFDKSKVNTERLLVNWLSPNDWTGAGGFRYGNVRFSFDWRELVDGKRAYWVESIAYGIPAARILITENDRSDSLEDYDPAAGDGPWWFDGDSNTHYWNGNCCLEVMFEGDLALSDCVKIDFVAHHSRYCSVAPSDCPDRGVRREQGGALFLAGILGGELGRTLQKWVRDGSLDDELGRAFRHIRREIKDSTLTYRGKLTGPSLVGRSVARAILAAYARRNEKEMGSLLRLYEGSDAAVEMIGQLLEEDLGIEDWKDLLDI